VTPEQIVTACLDKGVVLRINPDGALTAIPKRKLSDELLKLIAANRPEVRQFVQERDGGGEEMSLEALAAPEPPPPSIGERIVVNAARVGVRIYLSEPTMRGTMRIETEWDRVLEVPDIAKAEMPAADYVGRQRKQVPTALAAIITTYKRDILEYLRAPYAPEPPPEDAPPAVRSMWERLARPDSMLPNARDNQKHIRALLFGERADDIAAERRSQQLDQVMPLVIAAATPPKRGE
jgi:hypothetical protein